MPEQRIRGSLVLFHGNRVLRLADGNQRAVFRHHLAERILQFRGIDQHQGPVRQVSIVLKPGFRNFPVNLVIPPGRLPVIHQKYIQKKAAPEMHESVQCLCLFRSEASRRSFHHADIQSRIQECHLVRHIHGCLRRRQHRDIMPGHIEHGSGLLEVVPALFFVKAFHSIQYIYRIFIQQFLLIQEPDQIIQKTDDPFLFDRCGCRKRENQQADCRQYHGHYSFHHFLCLLIIMIHHAVFRNRGCLCR